MTKKLGILLMGICVPGSLAFAANVVPPTSIGFSKGPAFTGVVYTGGTPCFDEGKGRYIKGCIKKHIGIMKEDRKQKIEQYKQQIKQEKEQIKEQAKQIRQKIKPILREGFKKLSDEEKAKLKQVRYQYLLQIRQLKQRFKTANKEERKQILRQIQDLREKMHTQIQQVVAGTDYAKLLQQKWEQIKKLRQQRQEQIQAVRQNIQQIRAQFRQARAELIAKYKTVIYQKFKEKIDNMSLAKLQRVKTRIERARQRFEKLPLKPETKEKVMSVLAALDEMITERIAKLQQQEQSINTDDLLNNLLGE